MGLVNGYHPNWEPFIHSADVQKEIREIERFLETEEYFPSEDNVLRFLRQDPVKTKAVIVGMEPYPSSFIDNGAIVPEATGRSFEVASVREWTDKFKQVSLRNILKAIYLTDTGKAVSMDELRGKIADGSFPISKPERWFDNLEEQGVIFLNATLTVRQYEVDTHTDKWETFMDCLIRYIEGVNPDVIWCLMGTKARDRFLSKVRVENTIITCHPRLNAFVHTDLFVRLGARIRFVI